MKAISLVITGNQIVYGRILFFSGLNILTAFLLNLLLPQYIGIDSYGEYRYFYNIIGFAGILHLGYLDGFYLISLETAIPQKASVSYLGLLVAGLLAVFFMLFKLLGITIGEAPFLFALLLLLSNFINLASQSLNLQDQFVRPIAIQLLISLLLLLGILHPTIVQWIKLHILQTIFFLLLLQLGWLLILNIASNGIAFVTLEITEWKTILRFHKKGIKTVAIGLIIILSMGLDKLVLKNQLSKSDFGIYCFSNSILISLLGLSLSISTKFVRQLYQDDDSLKVLYNQMSRMITCLGLGLIIASIYLSQIQWIETLVYGRLIKYLPASMGLFSYLCLIQLVHSNLAKVYEIETKFLLVYLIVLGCCFFIYQIGYRNLNQTIWLSSLLLYMGILIFDRLVIKQNSQIQLSLTNKIFAALPLVISFWLQSKI